MKAWWNQLDRREQRMVGGGAIIALLLLFYLWVWSPMGTHIDELKQQVSNQRALLQWMQRESQLYKQFKRAGYGRRINEGALLSAVDASLKQAKLGRYVRGLQQPKKNQVGLSLVGAPFDTVMHWLQGLAKHGNIKVVAFQAKALSATPGLVNAQLLIRV